MRLGCQKSITSHSSCCLLSSPYINKIDRVGQWSWKGNWRLGSSNDRSRWTLSWRMVTIQSEASCTFTFISRCMVWNGIFSSLQYSPVIFRSSCRKKPVYLFPTEYSDLTFMLPATGKKADESSDFFLMQRNEKWGKLEDNVYRSAWGKHRSCCLWTCK